MLRGAVRARAAARDTAAAEGDALVHEGAGEDWSVIAHSDAVLLEATFTARPSSG